MNHSPRSATAAIAPRSPARIIPSGLTPSELSAYISCAVRLIKPSILAQWAAQYPDAAQPLAVWQRLIESHEMPHFVALRRIFPHADQVTVTSRRTVTVFNVRGNHYRLLAALHYNRQLCFALRFLTHKDYDQDHWKNEL